MWKVSNNRPWQEAAGYPAPHQIAPAVYVCEGSACTALYLVRPGFPGRSAAMVLGSDPDVAIRAAEDYFNRKNFTFNVEAGLLGMNGEVFAEFRRVS